MIELQKFVNNLILLLKPWFVSVDAAYGRGMARTDVSSGETLTVPSGYCLVISDELQIDGDLVVDGTLTIVG